MKLRLLFAFIMLPCISVIYAQNNGMNKQMIIAAEAGDSAKVARYIKQGADVDARTPTGTTALMYAVQNGHKAIVRLLIRHDADTDAQPLNGVSALHSAVINNSPEILNILLDAGADPNLKDTWGFTPLHYASGFSMPVIAEYLLTGGANPAINTPGGFSPLHLAAFTGNPLLGKVLLHYGCPTQTRDKNGFMPHHITAQQGNKAFLKILQEYAVPITPLTEDGLSVLDLAAGNNRYHCLKYLVDSVQVPDNTLKAWNALTLNKRMHANDSISRVLKEHNQKLLGHPWFSKVFFAYFMNFTSSDFLNGFAAGLYDAKWNVDITMGFSWRPYDKPVFEKNGSNKIWQFREKRFSADLWLDKGFTVKGGLNKNQGFYLRAGAGYSSGHYAGTTRKAKKGFHALTGAGYYWEGQYFNAKIGYLYKDFGTTNASPHRIGIALAVQWPFRRLRLHSRPDIYD